MLLLLTTLATVWAAFTVWLIVRVVNRKEKWARRTLLAGCIGLPVFYLASFAPLMWLDEQHVMYSGFGDDMRLYAAPLRMVHDNGPEPVRDFLRWYERVSRSAGR